MSSTYFRTILTASNGPSTGRRKWTVDAIIAASRTRIVVDPQERIRSARAPRPEPSRPSRSAAPRSSR
jgi:hypothetical protein